MRKKKLELNKTSKLVYKLIISNMLLLISLVVLFIFPMLKPKDKMTRPHGIIYLIMYVIYMIMLFVM